MRHEFISHFVRLLLIADVRVEDYARDVALPRQRVAGIILHGLAQMPVGAASLADFPVLPFHSQSGQQPNTALHRNSRCALHVRCLTHFVPFGCAPPLPPPAVGELDSLYGFSHSAHRYGLMVYLVESIHALFAPQLSSRVESVGRFYDLLVADWTRAV